MPDSHYEKVSNKLATIKRTESYYLLAAAQFSLYIFIK